MDLSQILRGTATSPCTHPMGQATCLNRKKADLKFLVDLFVGHDILFTEHSEAPVTTLVVKDCVLSHNPLGAFIFLTPGCCNDKLFVSMITQ